MSESTESPAKRPRSDAGVNSVENSSGSFFDRPLSLSVVPLESGPEIPQSTLMADLQQTCGDASLPDGKVTFVIGAERKRVEHISKPILCVRSDYFNTMFRSGMRESSAEEIEIPDACPAAFTSLIKYLVSDAVEVDTTTEHAPNVLRLARKYQVRRLELLCLQTIEQSLGPENSVSLLQHAHDMGNERLFTVCRGCIAKNGAKVQQSGGVEKVQSLEIARGLLRDAINGKEQLSAVLLPRPVLKAAVLHSLDSLTNECSSNADGPQLDEDGGVDIALICKRFEQFATSDEVRAALTELIDHDGTVGYTSDNTHVRAES